MVIRSRSFEESSRAIKGHVHPRNGYAQQAWPSSGASHDLTSSSMPPPRGRCGEAKPMILVRRICGSSLRSYWIVNSPSIRPSFKDGIGQLGRDLPGHLSEGWLDVADAKSPHARRAVREHWAGSDAPTDHRNRLRPNNLKRVAHCTETIDQGADKTYERRVRTQCVGSLRFLGAHCRHATREVLIKEARFTGDRNAGTPQDQLGCFLDEADGWSACGGGAIKRRRERKLDRHNLAKFASRRYAGPRRRGWRRRISKHGLPDRDAGILDSIPALVSSAGVDHVTVTIIDGDTAS